MEDDQDEEDEPDACVNFDEFKQRFFDEYVDLDPTETARQELARMFLSPKERTEDYYVLEKHLGMLPVWRRSYCSHVPGLVD